MKKTATLLTALLSVAGLSAFGQGYFSFGAGTATIWNEFNTPGVGVRDNASVDVGLLWAATGVADTLPTVGTMISDKNGGSTVNIVATNGVPSISQSQLATMLGAGWKVATSSSAVVEGPDSATGAVNANGFSADTLDSSTAGATIQMILIGWNSSAGLGALTTGGLNGNLDFGYSGAITYLLGANATDPNGAVNETTANASNVLANQFGVAPVPEPGTLALAGLGGLSVLLFRRRNSHK